jgi:hypothetical protein
MNEQRQRYVHLLKQKEKELANKKWMSNPVENQENRRVPTQSFAPVPVKTEPGTEINYRVTPRSKAAEMEIINISDSSEDEMDIDSVSGNQRPAPLQENMSSTFTGDDNNIRPAESVDDGYFMEEPAAESYAYEPIVDSDDQQEPNESEVSSFKAPQKEEERPKSLGEKVTAMEIIQEPTTTPSLITEKRHAETHKDVVEEEQAPKRQQQESMKPGVSLSEAIKASETRPPPRMRSNPKKRSQKNKMLLSESLIQKERETLLEIGYFSQFSEPQESSFSTTGTTTATAAKTINPPTSSSSTLEEEADRVASHSMPSKKELPATEQPAKKTTPDTSPLIHQTPEIEFEEEFVADPVLDKPLPISEPVPNIIQEKPLPIALPVEETHTNDEYYDYQPEDQAFEYIDDTANVEDNPDNSNQNKDQPPSIGVTPTTPKEPKGNVLQLVADLDSFLQPSTPQPSSSSSAHYKSQNNSSNNFNSSFQPPGGLTKQSSTDSQRSQQSSGGKFFVDRDKSKSNDYYFTESHSRDSFDDREDPFRRKAMMGPLQTSRPGDDSYRRNYNYNHGSSSNKNNQVRREFSPEQKRRDDEYLRRTDPRAYYNNVKPDRRDNRSSYSNSRKVVATGPTLQEDRAEYKRFMQQKQQQKLREQEKDIEKWLGEESEDEKTILRTISEERKEKVKEKRKEE